MAQTKEVLTVLEYDGITNQTTIREMTADEIADLKAAAAQAAATQAEVDAKATARASALAKLADLGLTAEEIAAL